jgi:hypothetical protein
MKEISAANFAYFNIFWPHALDKSDFFASGGADTSKNKTEILTRILVAVPKIYRTGA